MSPRRLCLSLALSLLAGRACAEVLYVPPTGYRHTERSGDPAVADSLSTRAIDAAKQGDLSTALRLASQALYRDPSNQALRRAFGYELVDGEFLSGYQAKQHRRGYAWDPRFGWVKPADLTRWESGERPAGKRWVSLEVDRDRHADIDDGWQVRTDHCVVTTNHSIESATRLAAELEDLFQVWRQLFAGYWLDERDVRLALAGERSLPEPRRPFRVFYHRDKPSYVEHLRRRQPRIAETLGIYFDTAREAHFYHSDDSTKADRLRATLYHEATHQLFQESATKARSPGESAGFWVIEGVACWFETLRPTGPGMYAIGAGGRLRSASRIESPRPIAELAALGRSDLQRRGDLAAVYAQSTALVAMLMEEHPAAFARYVRAVYNRRPDAAELPRQLGISFAQIDLAYRRYASGRLRELAEPAAGH